MKPVLFVICFTLGVTLMIFSGYLPQSASARGSVARRVGATHDTELDRSPAALTVTRRVLSHTEDTPQPSQGESAGAAPDAVSAVDVIPAPPVQEPEPASEVPVAGAAPPPPAAAPATSGQPPAVVEEVPLYADAGPDRVIWAGWDELPLDGSASRGRNLTYLWQQISGPQDLAIEYGAHPVTTARGLLDGARLNWRTALYEFALTVTDETGANETDYVKYTVRAAPLLRIKPAPERRFELRNGYQLAHFTSWITNLDSYEAVFEIAAPSELTLTKVAGDACEVTGGKLDGAYLYQAVVYGQAGQATSWVEFLVNTEDNIPAIVQLGANWEAR
jgi:hypothetical protein